MNVSIIACGVHHEPWIHKVELDADSRPVVTVFEMKAPYLEGKSLQSFLASFMVGGSIFVLEVSLYILLRNKVFRV